MKLEAGKGLPSANVQTLASIKACLEAKGIQFITAPDGAPGIIIRTPTVKT